MTISRERIVGNVSILMVSQAIGWGLGLIITIFLPRYLGAEDYGKLALAYSLWTIISIFGTFGMDTYLTREVAREHDLLNELLSKSFLIRTIFFFIGAIVLSIYLSFTNYSPETILVIAILGINSFIGLLNFGIRAAIQGLERINIIAYSNVLIQFLSTAFGFLAIFLGLGVTAIAWQVSILAIITFIILLYSLLRYHPFKLQFSIANIRGFLIACFSFFLLTVFITLYHQVDMVVISLLTEELGVGLYTVADKLLGTIFFIPTIFMTVLYPVFSRLSKEDFEALRRLFRKSFHLMVWMGTALGLGTFIIANQVVLLIYGEGFIKSGPVLSLRAIVTAATFANIILGMFLVSIDRQKAWLTVLATATLVQIPLNIKFVPLFEGTLGNGAMGAALSCAITESCMMIAGVFLLPKHTLDKSTASYCLRTMLAGIGMVAVCWWFRNEFILLPVFLGAATYILISYVLRLFAGEEWKLLFEAMEMVRSKIRNKVLSIAN